MTAASDSFWHDKRLSIEAKAVAIYVLARCSDAPDIRRVKIGEALRIGPQKLRRIFRELVDAGYLSDRRQRMKGQFAGYSLTPLARGVAQ